MKIEQEYKILINKEIYDKIIADYKDKSIVIDQTNDYYDSIISTHTKKISIRIRTIDNHYYFTLKHHLDQVYEYEFEIKENNLNDERIIELLNKFDIKDLHLIGSLHTIRTLYKDEFGELCIDYNEYNGHKDYELEYELFDSSLNKINHFNNILAKYHIEYISNCDSKVKRFKKTLKK